MILLASCQHATLETNEIIPDPSKKHYIFLGHTYDWQRGDDKVDGRIEHLNLNSYDEIWLGGDICSATTKNKNTLFYLDDLFDLSAPTTHWATGNHDVRDGPREWIEEKTKRPLYYTDHQSGITKIVMNTNIIAPYEYDCEYIDDQYEMILNVLDTIQHSTHLVLLMHYVLWLDCEKGMKINSAENANASWVSMTCAPGNLFHLSVYPKLIDVQQRGVEVIVVSGDCGQYGKRYEYITTEGIQFFMSGINNSFDMGNQSLVDKFSTNPDSILIFHHDISTKELVGEFYELNDL